MPIQTQITPGRRFTGEEAIQALLSDPDRYNVVSGGATLAQDQRIRDKYSEMQAAYEQQAAEAEAQRKKYSGVLGLARGIGEGMINPFVKRGKLRSTFTAWDFRKQAY